MKSEGNEDYAFREGRGAGKLAMQRRLLDEKKREIEGTLKGKRREEERLRQEISSISDQPVFVPDYRIKESGVGPSKPEPRQRTLPAESPLRPEKSKQSRAVLPAESTVRGAVGVVAGGAGWNGLKSGASSGSVPEELLRASCFRGRRRCCSSR